MNSKKLGLFAAAALTTLAAQASAKDAAHKDAGKPAAKTATAEKACYNSCAGKGGSANCGGHNLMKSTDGKEAKTEAECKKVADAEWRLPAAAAPAAK